MLRGHPLAAADRRVVEAFAAQAAVALRQERLAEQAAAVGPLAEVDKLRTALLSAVSHDLRTPAGLGQGRRRRPAQHATWRSATPTATNCWPPSSESLDRLTRLVENLLDMSRLQAGALGLHPQPMSMAEAVAEALDDLGAGRRDVAVHIPDEPPEVHADPVLIERVLVNLLANALRYSPADRPPMISVSDHAGYVETRVIDHGPGIPATEWDDVFLPFQRLGDRDNDTGVGLGLALSRGLAEAMGGTLHAGEHPRRRPDHDAAPAHRRDAADHRRPPIRLLDRLEQLSRRDSTGGWSSGAAVTRILIVDDEPQILRALRINLQARQYDVSRAADGAEALHAAATAHPDLIVLDLGLPDIDGVEVIRKLRAWTPVPIVVLSGRADSRDKVDALDAGADDYVTKPFSIDELLARIRAVTRRQAGPEPPGDGAHRSTSEIDLANHRVTGTDGADRAPDPTEWQLLEVLVAEPGKLISQRQLLQQVWGPTYQHRDAVPAPVHGPAAPQARGRSGPAASTCSPSPAWATASRSELVCTQSRASG